MSVIKFKPTSAGKRGTVKVKPDNLWKGRPLRKLVESKKSINGRNSHGHITTRHRGGGHKRLYRLIDFKRNKDSIHHIVSRIEYDPNRSCLIALVTYSDGEKRYILSNKGLKVGDFVNCGGPNDWAEIKEVKVVRSNPEEKVYNITVDGLHSYIANGLVVHNK